MAFFQLVLHANQLEKVRKAYEDEKLTCVVFLLLPQLFSRRGKQALMAYAFILALTGPVKNTLHNMGILSESLSCAQVCQYILRCTIEQLKEAVKTVVDLAKQPFYALRDAISKVVKSVKVVVKKIKQTLIAIKRIVLSILRVISSVFQWLGSIINMCNKKLGTPFERCQNVFEGAVADCKAKLGPYLGLVCNITYIVSTLCYIVKPLDFICMLVSYISDAVVGVVRNKEYYGNRKHVFHARISRVLHYRYKWLTSERYDNRYITNDIRTIDLIRARQDKETVLPLNPREQKRYASLTSAKLIKPERVKLARSLIFLSMATMKLITFIAIDYSLYWILKMIQIYGRYQSKVERPSVITIHVAGDGYLAELYRSIIKSFTPHENEAEIDTLLCLPDPIPPNTDKYVQIIIIILLCWLITVFEPYGLRLRQVVMCQYYPDRAKQRAIWLYNHIIRYE
ncbi:DC-STAMP domain-containing protein 2-like [Apis florea]|uniref:DC-STAMP domain-containing protein 2-like n=1 Tax=Apis florea TaxID=7463 RepID=UPI0012FE8B47|nr:DC-STAMP domain-containing protein 2-like [Apis florea]